MESELFIKFNISQISFKFYYRNIYFAAIKKYCKKKKRSNEIYIHEINNSD